MNLLPDPAAFQSKGDQSSCFSRAHRWGGSARVARTGCVNTFTARPQPAWGASATAGVKLRGRNAYGEAVVASSGVPLER